MARISHPTSRRRTSTARAAAATTAGAPASRETPTAITPAPVGNMVPTYNTNQSVLIQYRTDIWIPGVVTRSFYNSRFACLVTEVEFYAADGSRTRAGFLDRDIRPDA